MTGLIEFGNNNNNTNQIESVEPELRKKKKRDQDALGDGQNGAAEPFAGGADDALADGPLLFGEVVAPEVGAGHFLARRVHFGVVGHWLHLQLLQDQPHHVVDVRVQHQVGLLVLPGRIRERSAFRFRPILHF